MCVLQEFSLCDRWLQMYSGSEQLTLQLRTEHLLHLLEQGHPQQACQVRGEHSWGEMAEGPLSGSYGCVDCPYDPSEHSFF